MKKFLTMVVALILIFCVCSSCISKKEEAEYKAKVKQELDSIPIEETGYKLVETNTSDNEVISPKKELSIDGHTFDFDLYNGDTYFAVTIDKKLDECKEISFSKYGDAFKDYNSLYGCWYFDDQIFIIRYKLYVRMLSKLKDFLPPVLFLYNYEENTIKYCGYFEEWFNYRVFDAAEKYFKIVKI